MNMETGGSSQGGKKGLIIGIIVVVLILAGGMLLRGKSPAGSASDAVASLSELMARGKSAKCEYSTSGNGVDQTSVVYYDGKKVYMENTSMVGGKEVKAKILIDDAFQYMWSDDGTNQGIKIPVPKDAGTPSPNVPTTGQASQVDYGKNLQMRCGAWSADESVFSPPANVTFTDLSQMGAGFGMPSGL